MSLQALRAAGEGHRTRIRARDVLLLLLLLLLLEERRRSGVLTPPVRLRAAHHHPPIVLQHPSARRHLVLPQELRVDLSRLAKLRLESGEVGTGGRLCVVMVRLGQLRGVRRVGEGLEWRRVVDVSHGGRAGGSGGVKSRRERERGSRSTRTRRGFETALVADCSRRGTSE